MYERSSNNLKFYQLYDLNLKFDHQVSMKQGKLPRAYQRINKLKPICKFHLHFFQLMDH